MTTTALASFVGPSAKAHSGLAEYRKAEAAVVEQAPASTPFPRLTVRERAGRVAVLRTVLLIGCVAVAAVAGAAASGSSQPAEPELAVLLRGMAAIKGLLALLGAGLVYWRFGLPISTRAAFAYIACVGLLFVACVLIWQLAFISLAAVLFHVAGIGALLVAWREGRHMPHFGWQAPNSPIERTA